MSAFETLSTAVGRGLVAGVAGTAAMTVSSTVEARLRGRPASHAPADATAKALGIKDFESAAAYDRFSTLSHWGYGTGWGVVRGLLRARGLPPGAATAAHGAAVWGNAQVALPVLDVAPPVWMWPRRELAIDLFHHAVYALATAVAYERIGRRRT
jgi:hypothetical protein